MIETTTEAEVEAARVRMLEAAQRLVAVLEEACLDSAQCDERLYPWEQVYGLSLQELEVELPQRDPHGEPVAWAGRRAWREARAEYERLIGADVYVSER
jgi:hypothetical protein